MNTLKTAISLIGGVTKLARALGVSNQAVHGWMTGAFDMKARHAAKIEELTGGRVEAGAICRELVERRQDKEDAA